MPTAHLAVTILAAALVGYSAAAVLTRARWVVESLNAYGVARSWWPWLGVAKAAGAAGLLIGLLVPVVGLVAGIGLVLYFVGAVGTVVRARYSAHIPYPLIFLGSVVASMALGLAT